MESPTYYEIRVNGHLESAWADWFGGLAISNLENGEALLAGTLPDQAALHGVLNRISNLGLILISVNPVAENDQSEP
jgi:hypothetical protein